MSRLLAVILRSFTSRIAVDLTLGVTLGTLLLANISLVLVELGGESIVRIGLAMAACCAIAGWAFAGTSLRRAPNQIATLGICTACVLGGPWLFRAWRSVLGNLGTDALSKPEWGLVVVASLCLIVVAPVLFGGICLICGAQQSTRRCAMRLVGMALSWCLLSPLAAGLLSLWGLKILAVIGAATCLWLERRSADSAFPANEELARKDTSFVANLELPLISLMVGAGLVLAGHVGRQLVPESLFSSFAGWGGVVAGIASALAFRPRSKRGVPQGTELLLILAGWASALLVAYSVWFHWALWTNAWIASTPLILLSRTALLAGMTLPFGYCWGRIVVSSPDARRVDPRIAAVVGMWGIAGFALTSWLDLPPDQLALGVSGGSLSIGLIVWLLRRRPFPASVRSRFLTASTLAGIVAAMCLTSNYRPGQSEKVLFSTSTFLSLRQGVDQKMLPWLDDGRLLDAFETTNGRWSMWRHRGSQLLLRKNGITADFVSTDPRVSPRAVSEVVPALLPLSIHPSADHVLVVGLHPSSLQTCDAFPLRSITAITQDRAAHRLAESLQQQGLFSNDSRFRLIACNPALAMSSKHVRAYDVIVCPGTRLMTLSGAAEITQSFYESVSRKLNDQGLFCQRIAYYDLGPDIVRQLVGSLRATFAQVLVVESVPGELVFLAANHQQEILGLGVIDRLQTPHARTLLSQVGWDWSVLLSRGSLDDDALAELLASGPPSDPDPVRLAFALPVEIARWGNKLQATRSALAPHGQTLGSRLGEPHETQEIGQRLEDLRLAHQVLSEHPDQFWAYRSVLKQQLKERPRSKIIPVKHEGLKRSLHPEDRRRKDYILALDAAASQATPDAASIADVVEFAAAVKFDPLVNPFVHHEVALLYERAGAAHTLAEFQHRLHAIYYAPPQDRSIGNLTRAIQLLVDDPELVPHPAERWDHLNALLDVLRMRWQVRAADTNKKSKYEPIHTERSITAAQKGLAMLDELHTAAGVPDSAWTPRQEFLEKHLLRALRALRSRQLRAAPVARSQ